MHTASVTLPLLTCADVGGRSIYRAVQVELSVRPGAGRLWVDVAASDCDVAWQRALRDLGKVGRAGLPLDWDGADLFVSCRARNAVLDGRSASLPLFLGWVSLLSGQPLPSPFLATGVSVDARDALVPAPKAFLQGKLDFADSYVRQLHPGARAPVYVPAGSEYDARALASLEVREVQGLTAAARQVLNLAPHAPAPANAPEVRG